MPHFPLSDHFQKSPNLHLPFPSLPFPLCVCKECSMYLNDKRTKEKKKKNGMARFLAEVSIGVAGGREAIPVVRDEHAWPQASEGLVADDGVFAV